MLRILLSDLWLISYGTLTLMVKNYVIQCGISFFKSSSVAIPFVIFCAYAGPLVSDIRKKDYRHETRII
jgi:hypothetical protein